MKKRLPKVLEEICEVIGALTVKIIRMAGKMTAWVGKAYELQLYSKEHG